MVGVGFPDWLYPITGWTIGIILIVVVFLAQVVDMLVTHWREDRRDKRRHGHTG